MKLEIGDKIYELSYTINSAADIEEMTGRPFSAIFKTGEFSGLRLIFWCGLLDSMPKISKREAGNILEEYINEGHTMEEVSALIDKAASQSGFLSAQQAKTKTKPKT